MNNKKRYCSCGCGQLISDQIVVDNDDSVPGVEPYEYDYE
jgi:hypothetical protein